MRIGGGDAAHSLESNCSVLPARDGGPWQGIGANDVRTLLTIVAARANMQREVASVRVSRGPSEFATQTSNRGGRPKVPVVMGGAATPREGGR